VRPARENPFRSERVDALPFLPQGMTWEALLLRLEELQHRAALVGPDGSGKTTLLRELAQRLEERGYCTSEMRIRIDEPNPGVRELRAFATAADARTMLIFDGADHLAPRRWRTLKKASRPAAGLIVTSHGKALLPTLIETTTSVELTHELIGRLVGVNEAEARRDEIAALFDQHGGNVRDVLRALYDRWAEADDRDVETR
jgi:ABC-type dipeptide/oligopeptide/nickel transport system ATPase component